MTTPHPLALALRRDLARLEADARLATARGDERAALARLLEADAVRAEIVAEESPGAVLAAFRSLAGAWRGEPLA